MSRNLGLSISRGKYIVFLDDDNIVTSSFLDILIKNLEQNMEFSAMGSVTRGYFRGELQHYVWKISLKPISLLRGQVVKPDYVITSTIQDTDFIPNAFVVRRDVAVKIDGFDPTFPIYFDDTDFGFRLKTTGKLGVDGNAVIRHKGSPNTADISPFKAAMNMRGFVFFIRKHAPWMIYFAFAGMLLWFGSYLKIWVRKPHFKDSVSNFFSILFKGPN